MARINLAGDLRSSSSRRCQPDTESTCWEATTTDTNLQHTHLFSAIHTLADFAEVRANTNATHNNNTPMKYAASPPSQPS